MGKIKLNGKGSGVSGNSRFRIYGGGGASVIQTHTETFQLIDFDLAKAKHTL